MYAISFDTETRTLRLTLEGFWTAATLIRFKAELLVKVTASRLRYGNFAILSDSSSFPVQSAEIARGFEHMMLRGVQYHSGPIAIVVASVLNKLQAERTFPNPRVGIFLDIGEARDWLAMRQRAASAGDA